MNRLQKRLTKKEEWIDYAGFTNDKHNYRSCSNYSVEKLGQLEDIEEELGIDLITLFKALKVGIFIKNGGHLKNLDFGIYNDKFAFYSVGANNSMAAYLNTFYIKDYGKTWWLEKPKEKIEND